MGENPGGHGSTSAGSDANERRAEIARGASRAEFDLVRSYLEDREPAVRRAALAALVAAGAAGRDEVEAALADPEATVRSATLELGTRLPRVDLSGLLDDPDARVVEAAAFAIGEFEDASYVAGLISVARGHEDALARESAIAALGAIGDERALEVILAALGDVPAVRRRAVVALSAFDSERTRAALTERLSDRDWQVRQAAEEVLGLSGDPPR